MADFSEDDYDDDGVSVCTEDLEMELQVLEHERQAISKIEQLKRLIAAGRRSASTFSKQAQALKNKCVRQQLALDNSSNADKSFSTHRVSQLKDRLSSRTAMTRERRRQRTARRLKCVHQAAKSALQIDLLSIANGEWDEQRVFPPSLGSTSAQFSNQMAPRLTHSLSGRGETVATTAFQDQPTQRPSEGHAATSFRAAVQQKSSAHHETNSRNFSSDQDSFLRESITSSSPPRSSTTSIRSPPVSPGNVSAEIAQLIAEDEVSNDKGAGVVVLSLHDVDNLKGELSESDDEMAELEAESKTSATKSRSTESSSRQHQNSTSRQSISAGKPPSASSPKTETEIRFEKAKTAALERQRAAEQRLSEAESAAADRRAQRDKLAEERRLAQEEIKRTNELSQRLQRENLAEARRLAQEEIDRTNDASQRMKARVGEPSTATQETQRLPGQLGQSTTNHKNEQSTWNEQDASLHVATDADFGLQNTTEYKHEIHEDNKDRMMEDSTNRSLSTQHKGGDQWLPPRGHVSAAESVLPASAIPTQSGGKIEKSGNSASGSLSAQQHDSSIEMFIGAPSSTRSQLLAGKVSYGDYPKATKRFANSVAATTESRATTGKEEWGYNHDGDYVKLMVPHGSSFQQELNNKANMAMTKTNFAAKPTPSTAITLNSKARTQETADKPDDSDSVKMRAASSVQSESMQTNSFPLPPGPSTSVYVQPPPPQSWSLNEPVSENRFAAAPDVSNAVAPPPPPLDETVMPGFAPEGRPPDAGRRETHSGPSQRNHNGILSRSAHPPPSSTSLNAIGPPTSSSSEAGNFATDVGGNSSRRSRRGGTSSRTSLETADLFSPSATTNSHAAPPASSPRKPSRRVSRRSSAVSVADSGALSDDSDFSSLASSPRAGHSTAPPQPQRFNFGQARTTSTQKNVRQQWH
eukprot:INCI3200.1.p1 GENE.INCI3200.1~~INCI3200.1.p1  ORF type:complete len:924 (+),score=165.62 INCI3200.1:322-3093(+)